MTTDADAYRLAFSGAVILDRSDRDRLDVTGPDRAKFLHNLTTNDLKRLPTGQGVEAFVTSPQGKTLGYVTLLAAEDRVIIRTEPGGAAHVLPHFRKYGVFDDVEVHDLTGHTSEFHVAGPSADAVVAAAGAATPEPGDLRHAESAVAGIAMRVVRESPLGVPGLSLLVGRADGDAVRDALRAAGDAYGMRELDAATAEALRIEAGIPAFGRDVQPDNLPQEVARDARAINFVKGCYLGQETVARIDALGHVNKLLRGLWLEDGGGEIAPPAGSAVEADGKTVGAVTSSAFSPGRGGCVALGYVRTSHAKAGTAVAVVVGGARRTAVVTDLPMPPSPARP